MVVKAPSSSRLARFAKLGWLSRRALPIAWARLAEMSEAPPEDRPKLAERALRRHQAVAEEAFRTLGGMKGLAMKLGQQLSYVDGILPAGYRAVYQEVLARLQREAPPLALATVEPTIVAELERPLAELFSDFEDEPFAAASIGQVHRARLRADGTEVAVKVQYPGVDRAIAADLGNFAMVEGLAGPLLGLAGRAAMRQNAADFLAEIRARLLEELDYRREATMQRRFADIVAGDPDLRVPRVIDACSGQRVLTTELVRGRTLVEVCERAPQDDLDRWAVALTRLMFTAIYDHRLLYADPHPGNYLFPDDGSVVLLDFGCTKELPEWMVPKMRRYFRGAVVATRSNLPADWREFEAAIADAFQLDPNERGAFDLYRRFILYCLDPYLRDEPFEFTPEWSAGSMSLMLDGSRELVFGQSKLPKVPELPPVPADFAFVSRLQWGFYSVLAMMRARGNWYRTMPASLRGGLDG